MYKNNILKIGLTLVLVSLLTCPTLAYGRIKDRTILYNPTTGHDHDGSTKGKKIDSGDVVNTPSGNIVATNTQNAVTELDIEKIDTSEKGAANGLATLNGSSEITAIQLPAIAITDVNVCVSQVCQLALIAEEGDVCVRTDEDKSYVHNGGIANDMTDWTLLLSTGLVTSVNSETGDVVNVERTTRLQTTISDSDSNYPSSGAIVDYVATHASGVSAHHSNLSDGLAITPYTVAADAYTSSSGVNDNVYNARMAGDSYWRTYLTRDGALWFGGGAAIADTNLYRSAANLLKTDDAFVGASTVSTVGDSSNFTHSSTTKYATYSGASFHPLTTAGIKVWANYISPVNAAAPEQGNRGVDLPIGATVTRLDSYGFTNTTNDYCTVYLEGRSTSGSVTSVAGCIFQDGANSCSDTIITNEVIVSDKGYNLRAEMYGVGGSSDSQLYQVKITYTIVNVSQTR